MILAGKCESVDFKKSILYFSIFFFKALLEHAEKKPNFKEKL